MQPGGRAFLGKEEGGEVGLRLCRIKVEGGLRGFEPQEQRRGIRFHIISRPVQLDLSHIVLEIIAAGRQAGWEGGGLYFNIK